MVGSLYARDSRDFRPDWGLPEFTPNDQGLAPLAIDWRRFAAAASCGRHLHKPNESLTLFIASSVIAMNSSSGTPSCDSHSRICSRRTCAANALSFIFFFTLDTSTSASFLLGRTSVTAMMNPVSSSTQYRDFRNIESSGCWAPYFST